MNKKLDCIAFHEAGHAVAHILAGIPFENVCLLKNMQDGIKKGLRDYQVLYVMGVEEEITEDRI